MNDKQFSPPAKRISMFTCSRRQALATFGAIVPAVMVAPLSGCAWNVEVVHADPGLASIDIVQGKITILPVKFDGDKAKPQERSMCALLMIRAVRQVREDISVVSNDKINNAINGSLEAEAEMLKFYEPEAASSDATKALGQAIGVRYFILTRLNYDQRAVGGGGRLANSTTESTLNGDVQILDTTTGHVVWEGKFSSTKSGIDTIVDPSPSKHGLAFFTTFVKAWPAPQPS